ncbi:uncharacterized protein KY384_003050 [Bacidia gigantensis]|uniref:uncharacterized protein n=1 Tax=Bacidia gigantensis TaxID=2732470 RepID=UPI001D0403F2|nr:uncharacterized protein KY384_003050 [Bacidia gigantensis]KAG8531421.1 hypothetical protein KY384_003050 [Bacidia gigantensis]
MREAVRLLSRSPISETSAAAIRHSSGVDAKDHARNITDPFSCPTHTYTYSTNGDDTFPAPAAYLGREYSWIHIFPEGKVHQHPKKTMRYFKWGVARLILEPDVCPDLVPMWIEGNDQIMHETRKWPRFIPRIGKQCGVWIGENVGGEKETVFHELRERWQKLKLDSTQRSGEQLDVGNLNDELKYGQEAVELREECARQVRKAVLDVRRKRGLPDEDPKAGLVETWREEGGKAEGRMKDDSIVKDA